MNRSIAVLLLAASVFAQQKRIPPPGIEITPKERAELTALIDARRAEAAKNPDWAARVKAVDWALRYNEFFKADEVAKARMILDPEFSRPGLQVHGYKSRIDDSIQPYGVVLPPSYSPTAKGTWRLDIWLHGRGETITELNFIHQRLTSRGEFTPPDTIVLHPFGRYCNAFKFAGETDVFEALTDLQKRYRIDPDRISIRGFSMGGAGAWHIAAHHPGEWVVAGPGAGFVDTEEYRGLKGDQLPPWYEQKLWTMTNAKEYALNLFALPVVAYSGELDRQKAAADIMAREMMQSGVPLTHIIGPKTEHRWEPGAKEEVGRRVDAIATRGRHQPRRVRFVTYTTRHHHSNWVLVHELKRHWDRAEVDARITEDGIQAATKNVGRIEFYFGPGEAPFPPGRTVKVVLDAKSFEAPAPSSDGSWKWHSPGSDAAVWKRPGIQGPIDDAFFDRFIFVRPSGDAEPWVKAELDRAIDSWRRIFRGEPIVKDEAAITADDIATAHLVLWGTPKSNKLIAKWPTPMAWPGKTGQFLAAIYPNPENPRRYVVLNSGHTFREASEATNAEQTAKLPDWAVIEEPYRVVDAGFFGEDWKTVLRKQ